MDLRFTDSENAFRSECRGWLEANAPREPLPSGDTKEGFALHLEWEHRLFDAGWAAVSWPKMPWVMLRIKENLSACLAK